MRQLDGCDWWSQNDTDIAKAAELAAQSDIAIVAVGTRSIWLGRVPNRKKSLRAKGSTSRRSTSPAASSTCSKR